MFSKKLINHHYKLGNTVRKCLDCGKPLKAHGGLGKRKSGRCQQCWIRYLAKTGMNNKDHENCHKNIRKRWLKQ